MNVRAATPGDLADNADARAVYERWGFGDCSATLLADITSLRERVG
jgi:hypothetical protein